MKQEINTFMKKFLPFIFLISAPALASTNQLDFMWGRGTPLNSIQAQGSAERDGLRGSFWAFDAMHHISNQLYLGVGIGHFTSADNNSATFIPNANSIIDSRKTSSLLLGRMDLIPGGRWVPYAIAGAGWVKNSLTVTSDQGTLVDDSKSTLGYAGGLGLDLILGDRLLIGIEARYEGSLAQTFGMTPTGVAASGQTGVRTSLNLFLVGLKAGVKY